MIQRTCPDTNQYLIFARLWVGNAFIGQNFGATELMNADGFHETRLLAGVLERNST
jgi:hypothetical protein